MLLDDETNERPGPLEAGKRPPSTAKGGRALVKIQSALLALTLLGGGAVAAKQYFDSTQAVTILAPPANVAASANTPPPWASWPLKFDATFQGSQLDTNIWATCYDYADHGCTNYGNNTRDPEKEWYLASQDQVSGGELHLVAQRVPTPGYSESGASEEYACRSGIVTSLPGFDFEYGYVQITAEIPFGGGLWPALWLGATNQKWPPEIDIMEHWHSDSYAKVYLHSTDAVRQGGAVNEPGIGSGWHTFGFYWTPTKLVWYYDGKPVFATSTGMPHQDMFILMNVADDANGPGTCSGSMNIRSVKVWQQPNWPGGRD